MGRGGGGCGVSSANEYSCAHHVTWRPNKLWRYNFLFDLWSALGSLTGCMYMRVHLQCYKSASLEGDLAPIFDFDVGTARPAFLTNTDRIRIKLTKIMRIYADLFRITQTHKYFPFQLILRKKITYFLFLEILISQKLLLIKEQKNGLQKNRSLPPVNIISRRCV
jgi:hypothetical protein